VTDLTPSAGQAHGAAAEEVAARRLLWRCRRGMKELDVMLERFAREALPAPGRERAAFGRLLELPDPELAGYLLGAQVPIDPALAGLIARIRSLCRSGA
jgi:antitoxin CptB